MVRYAGRRRCATCRDDRTTSVGGRQRDGLAGREGSTSASTADAINEDRNDRNAEDDDDDVPRADGVHAVHRSGVTSRRRASMPRVRRASTESSGKTLRLATGVSSKSWIMSRRCVIRRRTVDRSRPAALVQSSVARDEGRVYSRLVVPGTSVVQAAGTDPESPVGAAPCPRPDRVPPVTSGHIPVTSGAPAASRPGVP
jgi:hypothetical protein